MEEKIELKTYTIADLRAWLLNSKSINGLSAELIAPVRAWAIVNNPYAEEEMVVLAALFVNDKWAAFTAVLPDKLQGCGDTYFWATTLYTKPEYEGRMFGVAVLSVFQELYGDRYLDMQGAPETVECFNYLGYNTHYNTRYVFEAHHAIRRQGIKGELAYWLDKYNYCQNKRRMRKKSHTYIHANFHIEYLAVIDKNTYAFIQECSKRNVFLRSQEMLNWILRFPCMIATPLKYKVMKENEFSSYCISQNMYAYRVLNEDNQLVGFIVLSRKGGLLEEKMLYYNTDYEKEVLTSIVEHIVKFEPDVFTTMNDALYQYIKSLAFFRRCQEESVSFSCPPTFQYSLQQCVQSSDGDMFI